MNILFIILFLATGLIYRLIDWGAFSNTEDFNLENCQVLGNFVGPEDIQVDSNNDILYISSTNYEASKKGKFENGGIYILDLKLQDAKPKLVSTDAPEEFRPHGISLYKDPETGEQTLFVVNHRKNQDTIEAFDIIGRGTLKHRETFSDPKLTSPNDILGVGKRSFYVSQDNKYAHSNWKIFFASFLGLEGGSVFYYDGKDWKIVAEDIHYANGLACSLDNKMLYLSETNKFRIQAYERNLETGELSFKESYYLQAGPDNLNIDTQGNLWVAAFPSMLAIAKHLSNKSAKCPVQIIRLKFDEDNKVLDTKNMLTSSGENVSGITTVDLYKDKIIISGLLNSEVRMCSLPKESPTENRNNVDL